MEGPDEFTEQWRIIQSIINCFATQIRPTRVVKTLETHRPN